MVKRAPARRRPRKAKPGTKGLAPRGYRIEKPAGAAAEAAEAIEKVGGCVVGLYKEPLGGHQTLLSILPIDRIEPTPFQRDLSDAHHKRLADVISKTGRFLDPVITVVAPGGDFWDLNCLGSGCGVVYKVDQKGKETVLYAFTMSTDGGWPNGNLIMDKAGNLYGTTELGGDMSCAQYGCGAIFKLTPNK